MTLALIVITLLYLFIIGRFVFGFDRIKDFVFQEVKPVTTFAIIIPFRNEAAHLPNLALALSELNYPENLFEVIFIDDESHDGSGEIITNCLNEIPIDFQIIKNQRHTNAPKKDAITLAIAQSKYDWIITTDSDCTFNKEWLNTLDAFIQEKNPKMVAGPVAFLSSNTFLSRFQILDFLSLIGATIGAFGMKKPFLCNGANLAYSKSVFAEVHGFEGNSEIASGDDIFLMEKILRKYPGQLQYLKHKDAIVSTVPELTIKGLVQQRKRWAAKTSSYTNTFGKFVGSIVLLFNFSLLAALFLSAFGVINIKIIGYAFLVKFCVDLLLILKTAQFFDQTNQLKSYFLSSLLYPFFNVYIALTSWFSGYTWKGRSFKK